VADVIQQWRFIVTVVISVDRCRGEKAKSRLFRSRYILEAKHIITQVLMSAC
jgi:hypothetical protein